MRWVLMAFTFIIHWDEKRHRKCHYAVHLLFGSCSRTIELRNFRTKCTELLTSEQVIYYQHYISVTSVTMQCIYFLEVAEGTVQLKYTQLLQHIMVCRFTIIFQSFDLRYFINVLPENKYLLSTSQFQRNKTFSSYYISEYCFSGKWHHHAFAANGIYSLLNILWKIGSYGLKGLYKSVTISLHAWKQSYPILVEAWLLTLIVTKDLLWIEKLYNKASTSSEKN